MLPRSARSPAAIACDEAVAIEAEDEASPRGEAGLGPAVLVSLDAAARIFGEIRRWADQGLRQLGLAHEALVYPLAALVPARALLCPLELTAAVDISELIIDGAAIPPDSIKAFSPSNCHFASTDPVAANRAFNAAIDAALLERPRLAVLSKLHSHPFAGGAFLSGGDIYHGISSPEALSWRLRRGLATALLHVAYPDGDPFLSKRPWTLTAAGALVGDGRKRVLWRLRSFASAADGAGAGGAVIDLGDARLVPGGHRSVRAARRPPYWRTRQGASWCDAQKASLRESGYAVSRNLLGRGWRRYLVAQGGRQLVIALPPDLPAAPPRLLEVHDALTDEFELLPLPRAAAKTGDLRRLSLVALARHVLGAARAGTSEADGSPEGAS